MNSLRVTLWFVALCILTLVSLTVSCLFALVLYRFHEPGGQPAYIIAGTILSAAVAVYSAVELVRFFRGQPAVLGRALALLIVSAGIVISWFCVGGYVPYPRHAVTTLIPELAVPQATSVLRLLRPVLRDHEFI